VEIVPCWIQYYRGLPSSGVGPEIITNFHVFSPQKCAAK